MNEPKKKKSRIFERCAYRCCLNSRSTGARLYRFPKYGDPRHDLWVQYTANPKLKTWSKSSIRCAGLCKDHFDPKCFLQHSETLRRDAIPKPFFFEALKTATQEPHRPEMKFGAIRKKICAVLPLNTKADLQAKKNLELGSTSKCITTVTETNSDPVLQSPKNDGKILQQKLISCTPDKIMNKNVQLSQKKINTVFSMVKQSKTQVVDKSDSCSPKIKPNVTDAKSFSSLHDDKSLEKIKNVDQVIENSKKDKQIVRQNLSGSYSKLQSLRMKRLQTKLLKLEKKKNIFQVRNILLRRKMKLMKEKLDRALDREERQTELLKKLPIDRFLDDSKCTSPLARTMVQLQVHKKNTPYSKEEKDLSILLYSSSVLTYTRLRRSGCILPSEKAVQNWTAQMNIQTIWSKDIFAKLKVEMIKLSRDERFCEVKFDDMSMKSYEEYSAKNEIIEDLVKREELDEEDKESHIFVVRLESLNAKKSWRKNLSCFMPKVESVEEIDEIVQKCLIELFEAEANVVAVRSDLGAENQYLSTSFLNASKDKPFVVINDRKYFTTFEFPHLLRKLLSTLNTHEILYYENKPICVYKDFVDAYKREKCNKASNLLAHITDDHLFPSSFEKMSTKHVFEVLDRRFVTAMRRNGDSTTFRASANFAERINTIINVFNGYKLTRGNAEKRLLLDGNPEVEKTLEEFIEWSSKWTTSKTEKQSDNVHSNEMMFVSCLEGFPISIAAILQTYRTIKEENSNF